MVSQLRIYTINTGMMDSWLKIFEETIRPLHSKLGIPVERTWVNAEANEFVWVRSFKNAEEIKGKEEAYFASDERKALGDIPQQHIAKMEVRVIEPVLVGSAD
jgi:hypothetical protein|tara:strand:- start:8 stop:316 length:309 start_codon:yes stop_codon:yes gene_type:complete